MPLPCHVCIENQEFVGIDDGSSSWRKTDVQLIVAGRIVRCYLLIDAYSGKKAVRIVRDDIGLERDKAKALIVEAHRVGGHTMQQFSCDAGEAFFDLESVIRGLFHETEAHHMIRRMSLAA